GDICALYPLCPILLHCSTLMHLSPLRNTPHVLHAAAAVTEYAFVLSTLVFPSFCFSLPSPFPFPEGEGGAFYVRLFLNALSEEVLFRAYIPERLCHHATSCTARACGEVLSVLLFALAHRPAGSATLFAGAAGAALRVLFVREKKRSGSRARASALCTAVHALWNAYAIAAAAR
ncbi:CPBP family glutamic-type intramembrane protease, partial [Treponema pallidum]